MTNDDYIKRSDAVFAFCGACEGTEICGQMGEPCDEVKRIMTIPAADVEPVRHGHYIGTEAYVYADENPVYSVYYEWKCSECDCVFEDDEPKYRYCPNCGAKMLPEPPKGEDNA